MTPLIDRSNDFVGVFDGNIAFLVFGPMMDVKLLFLYSTILRKRFIIVLGIALFIVIGAVSIYWDALMPR